MPLPSSHTPSFAASFLNRFSFQYGVSIAPSLPQAYHITGCFPFPSSIVFLRAPFIRPACSPLLESRLLVLTLYLPVQACMLACTPFGASVPSVHLACHTHCSVLSLLFPTQALQLPHLLLQAFSSLTTHVPSPRVHSPLPFSSCPLPPSHASVFCRPPLSFWHFCPLSLFPLCHPTVRDRDPPPFPSIHSLPSLLPYSPTPPHLFLIIFSVPTRFGSFLSTRPSLSTRIIWRKT